MDDRMTKLQERFRLESALQQQVFCLQETKAKLPEARYALRDAQQTQFLYPGSFRSFLDKLTGKAQEKQEALDARERKAKAALENLERLRESLEQDIRELQGELEILPPWESFPEEADPETRLLWAELECRLCAQALVPALEQCDGALEDYRSQLRGERMGEVTSSYEHHETGTNHIRCAESCAPWLQRLKAAMALRGKPFEAGSYFENPAGFIDGAAARHNRIDRVSRALEQTLKLKKQVAEIRKS